MGEQATPVGPGKYAQDGTPANFSDRGRFFQPTGWPIHHSARGLFTNDQLLRLIPKAVIQAARQFELNHAGLCQRWFWQKWLVGKFKFRCFVPQESNLDWGWRIIRGTPARGAGYCGGNSAILREKNCLPDLAHRTAWVKSASRSDLSTYTSAPGNLDMPTRRNNPLKRTTGMYVPVA